MKKQVLFVAVLAVAALFTSCRKDDINMSKPFRVQGEIDPGLSLPVISEGHLNLNDLLSTFDGTFSGYILDDTVITFHYDTSLSQRINVGNSFKANRPVYHRPNRYKDASSETVSVDTLILYEIPIDIFDKAVDIDAQIARLLLNLDVYVRGGCPENVEAELRENATISLNRLNIRYLCKDRTDTVDFDGNSSLSDSLVVDDIITGGGVKFTNVNLASIINDRPNKIIASFHMNLNVSTHFADSILAHPEQIDRFSAMLDSLKMTWLQYDADLSVDLPFEIRIGDMTFNYDIDMTGVASNDTSSMSTKDLVDRIKDNLKKAGIDLLLDSLNRFVFEFENGMPLNIRLNADFVDENDQIIANLFTNGMIASAVTSPVPGNPGVNEATSPSMNRIYVPLNFENLDAVFQSSKLKLTLGLSTTGTAKNAIKRTDYLKVKTKLQLHPTLSLDIPLFSNNHTN